MIRPPPSSPLFPNTTLFRSLFPVREEVLKPPVRLLRGAETGVLTHGPQATAVHRRPDPARERPLPGEPEALQVLVRTEVASRGDDVQWNAASGRVGRGPDDGPRLRRRTRASFRLAARDHGIVSVTRPREAEERNRHTGSANDLSHDAGVHVGAQRPNEGLRIWFRSDDRESHSHFERLIHLPVLDSSESLELAEHRRWLERFGNPEFDFRFQADQVPETPSGDVGHPMDLRTSEGAQHGSDVDRGRLEEFLSPRTPRVADLVEHREGRVAQDAAGRRQPRPMEPLARPGPHY